MPEDFVIPPEFVTKLSEGGERCVRCNRKMIKGRVFYYRHGMTIGLECNQAVLALEKSLPREPGETEQEFWKRVGTTARSQYGEQVSLRTRLGMAKAKKSP